MYCNIRIRLSLCSIIAFFQQLPHTDSFSSLRQSPSNLSLHNALTSSPVPWRDASMEVLVSPNDGPQISIEDFDDCLPVDSPFLTDISEDFDTISMCEINSTKNHVRLHSETSAEPSTTGIDKILDRKFACYGVSPRLSRKTNDFFATQFKPAGKGSRPTTLGCQIELSTQTYDSVKKVTK